MSASERPTNSAGDPHLLGRGSVKPRTPALLLPAPWGAARGLLPSELERAGVAGLVVGAVELALRPGLDTIAALGGLSRLVGGLPTVGEPGVGAVLGEGGLPPARIVGVGDALRYRNGLDGATGELTPEWSVATQQQLGVTVVVAPALPERLVVNGREQRLPSALAEQWLRRGAAAGARAALALIPPGSPAFQRRLLETAVREQFSGVAVIGAIDRTGWPREWSWLAVGLQTVRDLDAAAALGYDAVVPLFPTALARAGKAIVADEVVSVADFPEAAAPLDPVCDCPACRFALGYLAHLVSAKELLGETLLLLHNVRAVARRLGCLDPGGE
ncbi:MAG: hypothetical protein RMM58_07875 [Chloroflexota bacterium]|nr:hypothetical protein [Dehalococcoidia bacterium]MDW8253779.1 hypothetical protein [Chloroflexota bacterium]